MSTDNRCEISREELLQDIRRVAEELGETPTEVQYRRGGAYSVETFRRRFGSWNNGLEAAGLDVNVRKDITEEDLLDDLRRVAPSGAKRLPIQQYVEAGGHAVKTVTTRFGSWNAAVEAAGFVPDTSTEEIPEDALIEDIQSVVEQLGKVPTMDEYDANGQYSSSAVGDKFGSWNAGLERSGYEPNQPNPTDVSDEDLLGDLVRVADQLGSVPTESEYNERGKFNEATLRKRFQMAFRPLAVQAYDIATEFGGCYVDAGGNSE